MTSAVARFGRWLGNEPPAVAEMRPSRPRRLLRSGARQLPVRFVLFGGVAGIMTGQYGAGEELDLVKQHQRQHREADLRHRKENARQRSAVEETLFRTDNSPHVGTWPNALT